ncbi:MAG: GTPase HflX [Alphaproteobacteria bacterium]|nr:GTPase HflX [Alphaproteobacteria bacterium]
MPTFEFNSPTPIKAAVIFPEITDKYLNISSESRLKEAVGLALAINLDVVYQEIVRLRTIKPSTLLGQGVLERILPIIKDKEISLLIVDSSLTPIQQRNLEKFLQIKVIDRTALILEIFGERAQTNEGKLQVELAHLSYQRSRLVRSWTHLERQRGGAGFLGGPGETQIELDRRIIDDKILRIKKDLEKVRQTRKIQRTSRQRVPYPVIALVGYTNAGKSSLFNYLTTGDVLAKDMLFATLDTTMRKLRLPSGRIVILSDTVGFISDLPHELVMAFRATLEEVLEADIIVHVRDISNPDTKEQCHDVIKVLESLELENITSDKRYIELLNKVDLLSSEQKENISHNHNVAVSALSGEGINNFLNILDERLAADYKVMQFSVSATDGKTISWIHSNSDVISSRLENDKIVFKIRISNSSASKLLHKIH